MFIVIYTTRTLRLLKLKAPVVWFRFLLVAWILASLEISRSQRLTDSTHTASNTAMLHLIC